MPKNYYIILGIPATSTQEDIKGAYRRLAKEYHPDYYGKNHSPFQIIQEAYSVLSDPVRRQAYDLRRQTQRVASQHKIKVEPMRSYPTEKLEPLISDRGPIDLEETMSIRSFERYKPSFDDLVDRLFSSFIKRRQVEKRPENPSFIVTLTPEQAFRGGQVRVKVPVKIRCPGCNGYGGVGFYECWSCRGAGFMNSEYPVLIGFPPGISDNHVEQFSLERYGICNFYLIIGFRVSENI